MRKLAVGIVMILLCGCVTHRKPPVQPPLSEEDICADPMDAFFEPYVVKKGDTLFSIARHFQDRDTLDQIIRRNEITNPNVIHVGQTIYIQYQQRKDNQEAQPAAPR